MIIMPVKIFKMVMRLGDRFRQFSPFTAYMAQVGGVRRTVLITRPYSRITTLLSVLNGHNRDITVIGHGGLHNVKRSL